MDESSQPVFRTLILGDDNFTFTLPFIESPSRKKYAATEIMEVACCLPEAKMPCDFRPGYLAIKAASIPVHFSINPAQLRNHFFENQYDRIMVILPGVTMTGFPDFIDKIENPLFKLRIHMYIFSVLKASKNALKKDTGLIQILWPAPKFTRSMPWYNIDVNKIGPFCEVFRVETDDEALQLSEFEEWRPLIHNEPTLGSLPYLEEAVLYSWRVGDETGQKPSAESSNSGNLLFVPPELWTIPVEVIPHVNDLFLFEMRTDTGETRLVAKPTLKFDPRFRNDVFPRGRGGGRFNSRDGADWSGSATAQIQPFNTTTPAETGYVYPDYMMNDSSKQQQKSSVASSVAHNNDKPDPSMYQYQYQYHQGGNAAGAAAIYPDLMYTDPANVATQQQQQQYYGYGMPTDQYGNPYHHPVNNQPATTSSCSQIENDLKPALEMDSRPVKKEPPWKVCKKGLSHPRTKRPFEKSQSREGDSRNHRNA